MNYSMLLPRRSVNLEEGDDPGRPTSTDICVLLMRDKKTVSDLRVAADYFQHFR